MGPPDNEVGVALPLSLLLASSPPAWILVSGLIAYREGFEISISTRLREQGRRGSPACITARTLEARLRVAVRGDPADPPRTGRCPILEVAPNSELLWEEPPG